ESAHVLEANEALVVDVADHEPDFVHVCRQHHPWAAPALLRGDDVAQRVDPNLVDERLELAHNHLADLLFAARDAGCLADTLEQIDVDLHCPSHRQLRWKNLMDAMMLTARRCHVKGTHRANGSPTPGRRCGRQGGAAPRRRTPPGKNPA